MAQTKVFKLGVLELAGIGFASGVLSGAACSLAGYNFDIVVPYCAASGVVALPVLWFGAGVKLSRVIRRPRRPRVVPSTNGLIA